MAHVYKDNLVVDEQDNPIGRVQLLEAIEVDAILRIARVLVINPKNQLLLQQRNGKVLAPYKWNDSASGHVDYDEDYIDCAVREIYEEAGIRARAEDLEEVDYFFFVEGESAQKIRRFHKVYRYTYDGEIKLMPDEVEALEWHDIHEVYQDVHTHPDKFTGGFREVIKRYYKYHVLTADS